MTSDDADKLYDAMILELMGTPEFSGFMDMRDAIFKAVEEGQAEVTLPTATFAPWIYELEPLDFRYLCIIHNQLCDKHGIPDRKVPLAEVTKPAPGEDAF